MADLDALNMTRAESFELISKHVMDSDEDWAKMLRNFTTQAQFDRIIDEATELFAFIANDVMTFDSEGRYHINLNTLRWHLDHGDIIIDRWSDMDSDKNKNTFALDCQTFWSLLHLGFLLQRLADDETERRMDIARRKLYE